MLINKNLPVICDNCPLCPIWRRSLSPKQVTNVRQPQVLHEPVVLFVGQHPSNEEAERDMAFVGSTSNSFVEKLHDIGLWSHSVLTNIIKCAILRDQLLPEDDLRTAAKHCAVNLRKEIQKYRPAFICLLGSVAAGEFFRSIHVKRPPMGEFVRWQDIWVCWTYHPAAAARNPSLWKAIEDTLVAIKRRIEGANAQPNYIPYEIVRTRDDAEEVCSYFAQSPVVACDIEVAVLNPLYKEYQWITRGKTKAGQIISLALSDGKRTVTIVDLDGSVNLSQISSLKHLIFSTKPRKVYHNALFELMWFHRIWGEMPSSRTFADTMLMYYVIAEDREHHEYGLKNMAIRLLGAPPWADEKIEEARRFSGVDKLSVDELGRYNAYDAYWTLKLYHYLEPQVKEADLVFLLEELIYPLECLYALACDRGIRIDVDLMRGGISEIIRHRLDSLVSEIERLSKGHIKNPRSWQEKKYYLYQVLGLRPPQEEESTKRQVLSSLLTRYPEHQELLSCLIEFSQLDKIYSSYLRQWTKFVDVDGRVRGEVKFFGTKTGRLSIEEPPLHNFPSERTQSGREARRIFVPTEGYCFLECDASQFEVRVMAAKSGDPNLIEAFYGGYDIYTEIASIIFRKPPAEIDRKTERQVAKQAVLGIFYGISPFGLTQVIGISEEEAKTYIDRLQEHYPLVFRYMESVRDYGRKHGYVRNWLGRYRRVPAAKFGDARALRQIGNFVIQSEASDWWQMVSLWFFRLAYRHLGKGAVYILATIHDSMLAEVKVGYEEQAVERLRDAMVLVSTLWGLKVPIDGEYRFCYNSLGDEGEKQPLNITHQWRHGLEDRGKQLMKDLGLVAYKRRGL